MRVTYGINLVEYDDKYFKMAESLVEAGAEVAVPGRFLVEAIPSLQYLPSWFPGGTFKKLATSMRAQVSAAVDELFGAAVVRFSNRLFYIASLSCDTPPG